MRIPRSFTRFDHWKIAVLAATLLLAPAVAQAQEESPTVETAADSAAIAEATMRPAEEKYPNQFGGEFTPSKGFDIIKTDRASLNISAYGLFRYLNQSPGDQTYTDHLGREREVKARNDINWHRTFVWLTGFLYDQRLRYNISIWSLPTTQQSLIFGSLRYVASRSVTAGVGIGPNLTARSMQGSWPFWASSDRQMAEDFFRGGFSSSFFLTGEPVSRLYYTAAVTTNLSQLGVSAANDSRDFGYSASLWTVPTTGEFGPRGGFGDLEEHKSVATRFGMSAGHSRESRYAALNQSPGATQIKLSDGVNPFEAGALADTVTVQSLDYDEMAFDAGFKYRGFSFQGEWYVRRLSNMDATGPLPLSEITDTGFMAEAMHMVVPKKVGLYVAGGKIFDDFDRQPWELAYGGSFYPFGNRSWRLNAHVIRIDQSPASSNFGFYTAGQSGTTYSIGTDILL
jgi:hypothetical protein